MQILVVAATVVMIFVNYLSNALPLAGRTAKQVSDMFFTSFTPAGYTFAIWGIIYSGLIAFTVYQALPKQSQNPLLRKLRGTYVLSCLFNATWLFAWHNLILGLSLVLMLCLLASLIVVYLRSREQCAPIEHWLVRLPFSIYLGWITVATVANTSSFLVSVGYRGAPIPESIWAAGMVIVAATLGVLMSMFRRDLAYNTVLLWAFFGIYGEAGKIDLNVRTGLIIATAFVLLGIVASRLINGMPQRRMI